MLQIDAHQHFWKFDPVRDSWINDDMKSIQRDFFPEDLYPLLKENDIDGCVAVQVDQSEMENLFLLELASKYHFIKGIVGWVDLLSENIDEKLHGLSRFKLLKGFRHILQSEPDDEFMLQTDFVRGISALQKYSLTYDILIYPKHLKYAKQLVKAFPNQPFVIDHLAKPYIRDKNIDQWKKDVEALAEHENVWCKVSGMVTEANWTDWKREDFNPYLDTVFESFGTNRLLFGSDWPVCQVAASYNQVVDILRNYTANFSPDEQSAVWGGNAKMFYNLF